MGEGYDLGVILAASIWADHLIDKALKAGENARSALLNSHCSGSCSCKSRSDGDFYRIVTTVHSASSSCTRVEGRSNLCLPANDKAVSSHT